jgi:hypothetical protein
MGVWAYGVRVDSVDLVDLVDRSGRSGPEWAGKSPRQNRNRDS